MIISGFLLGLSVGLFCLGSCAPVFLPQILSKKDKWHGWRIFLEFNLGRLFAYIIFGAIVGGLGAKLASSTTTTLSTAASIILAIFLILYGLGMSLPHLKWCAWTKKAHFPFISGFLLGINICLPFLLAITQAFRTGGTFNGIIFFLAFFCGTTIYFIPLTFLNLLTVKPLLRRAARIAAIISGIIIILLAFKIL